jgi:hypothetical protein
MRILSFTLATFVFPLATADISGSWDLNLKADGASVPPLTCTLVQKGSEVTGSCKAAGGGDQDEVQISGGNVEGSRVRLGWSVRTPDGEAWAYSLDGGLDEAARAMKGTFKVTSRVGGADGTFTAKKRDP